ncbi:MAG: hypothetical protein M0P69_06410 [Bacteroidales bacterium]|nr:hypothetical protein [Bacteroidales bacterium]
MPKSRLRKIANDSSYLADFMAGVEPTGIFTFRNALENKENHSAHKAMGDVGGFVGGSLLGVLSSAGASKAVATALRKKSPALAKDFDNSAVGSLEALNPKKLKNYLQAFPELAKYKMEAGKVLADVKRVAKDVDSAKTTVSNLKSIPSPASIAQFLRTEANNPEVKSSVLRSRNLRRQLDNLQETETRLSNTYFGGASVAEGTEKALSATVGALAGVGGGALNAFSAHTQYDTGRATRKKIDAGEYGKEPLKKKASESSYLADFIAGADPTGVFTFRNAFGNEDNHALHKVVGDIGGFTGGVTLGALLSALAGKGATKVFRNKAQPVASKSLREKYLDIKKSPEAAVATAGALASSGALNALSAHTQYDSGVETRRKVNLGDIVF